MTGSGVEDLPVGRKFTMRKTVTQDDLLRFAELTGDFDRLHVDAEYCRTTRYGKPIAHGALIIGYMSAASSKATEGFGRPAASLGFDRIRHLKPVFVGDTLTVTYQIVETDPPKEGATARVVAVNQRGDVVAVADHLLKLV